MNKILDSFGAFFSTLDWKLLVAAIVMIIIVIISVYILIITAVSIQKRRIAIRVSLPNLESVGSNKKYAPQFEDKKDLETELINSEDDIANKTSKIQKDDYFIEALTMESKQYIPMNNEILNMPEAGEYEYNKEIEKEQEYLRKLAEADESDTGSVNLENLMNTKE